MTTTTHILYKTFHQSMYDKENNIITIPVHTASGNNSYAFTTSEFNRLLELLEHGHTTEIHLVSVHTGDTRSFHLVANYGLMLEYYNEDLQMRLIIQRQSY